MLRACEGPDALSATQQDAIVREAPEVFRRNCAVVSTYSASVLDILRVVSASVFTPGFLSLIAAIAAAGIVVAGVVFFLRRGGIIGSPLHGAAPAPSSEGAVGGGGATHEPRLGEPVEL